MSDPSRPALDPDEVASRTFAVVRRGYDPGVVRDLLGAVAEELRSLSRREQELRRELAQRVAEPAEFPLDEGALVEAVGTETARILQAAHDAARDIVGRAERQAAELVAKAEGTLAEQTRLADEEVAALRSEAREEVLGLQQRARDECREMVDEAREARRKILSDLVERRRALHLQLEQMRAGKDALAGIIDSVSYSMLSSVEEVRTKLASSEETARLAAASATIDPLAEAELALDVVEIAALGAGPAGTNEGPASSDDSLAVPDVAVEVDEATDGVVVVDIEPEVTSLSSIEPAVAAPVSVAADTAADHDQKHGSEIDELFERIRNERIEEVARARKVLDAPAPAEEEIAPDDEEVTHDVFDLLVRRDQLVGPALAELSRSLKRALRVEENELRDTARHLPNDPEALSGLIRPSTTTRLVDASERPLAQAFQSGGAFVAGILDVEIADITGDEPRAIAERLAEEIAEPLRQRIIAAARGTEEEVDPSTAVGTAFRDWRGARIETLAGDFATWAFSAGAIAAARAHGASLEWIVDDGDTNCPDCEDNALAGAIAAGEAFPTGPNHPPIHPGCRCLLVPSAAN